MPSFFPNMLQRHLPLTPPDHFGAYQDNIDVGFQKTAFQIGGQNTVTSHHEFVSSDRLDFIKHYSRFPATLQRQVYANENNGPPSSSQVLASRKPVSMYTAATAPLLPPIRCPGGREDSYPHQTKRNQPVPQPKQKAVGGVAVHLDYEMDQMADFVAEMAQGMYALYESRIRLPDIDIIQSVKPKSPVPPAFRKYVLQVLSSTRLPSSTILLGLYYLATRMTMLSGSGRYITGNGQVYRMLITSLLLGSKFLDDNTFQNRSWSEVSNIPVSELNELEIEWLLAVNWDMHISPDDPQGFVLWHKHWDNWQIRKVEISMEALKLTPLDPNVQRQRSTKTAISPDQLHAALYNDSSFSITVRERLQPQWQMRCHDQWPTFLSKTENSPPSAPETVPNTPERFSRAGICYGAGPLSYTSRTILPSFQSLPQSGQELTTQYHPQYAPNSWNTHGVHCACHWCVSCHDRFFISPGYGPQPVAG